MESLNGVGSSMDSVLVDCHQAGREGNSISVGARYLLPFLSKISAAEAQEGRNVPLYFPYLLTYYLPTYLTLHSHLHSHSNLHFTIYIPFSH